jgi:hypothetical protein
VKPDDERQEPEDEFEGFDGVHRSGPIADDVER